MGQSLYEQALQLTVVEIIKPNTDATAHMISGSVVYPAQLTAQIVEKVNATEVVQALKADINNSVEINALEGASTSQKLKEVSYKERITFIIQAYNNSRQDEADQIKYTDYVALMMPGISTCINAISSC